MQDFYRLVDGCAEKADEVQETVCKKAVLDMHYEAQVQCVINYSALKFGRSMKKSEARNFKLTREQYLEVKLDLFSDKKHRLI
jgi:hypothetical protein